MIIFALLLLLSFGLSSQAVAAVKWNNSSSAKIGLLRLVIISSPFITIK